MATERIADWFAAGERVAVENASGERFELFVRVAGDGGAPWATLLHGFPTCSSAAPASMRANAGLVGG